MFACSRSATEANVDSREYSKSSYSRVASPSRPTRVAREPTYSRHCRLVPHFIRINASVESRINRETNRETPEGGGTHRAATWACLSRSVRRRYIPICRYSKVTIHSTQACGATSNRSTHRVHDKHELPDALHLGCQGAMVADHHTEPTND